MDSTTKILILSVALIITVVLIIFALTINRTGKNTMDAGLASLSESTAELLETKLTQYDGSTCDGTRVVALIKSYWAADNPTCITVCTKDGMNIMYDHDGAVYKAVKELKGFPTSDAAGQPLSSNPTKILQASTKSSTGVETYDDISGYSCTSLSTKGYINKNASFSGSIQRDENENIRNVTFIQK